MVEERWSVALSKPFLENRIKKKRTLRSNWKNILKWRKLEQTYVASKESSQLFVYIFQATMELQGEITRGQMVIEKRSFLETSKKHNVDIIKSIETEKMKQLFMSAFGKKAAKWISQIEMQVQIC